MKYEALLNLKSGGSPVKVFVEASDVYNASRILKAQYDISGFFQSPHPVK